MTLYPKLILDALATVRYPGNKKNLVEAEMVADNLRIDGMKVSFSLIFEKPTDPFMKSMVKAAETAIHTYVSRSGSDDYYGKPSGCTTGSGQTVTAGEKYNRSVFRQRRCR